ncbi:recombinase family protein [Nocardioides sp. NPDC023903]|uniref:recombinase family protein n=1 Tax=Nocardioides sp. NPDC023903 TaxID=3157195 RepID=UPI003410D9C8
MTIALYTRLSPKPNGKYEGVDDQITWGTTYAANTWPGEPVEIFADRGISAANGDHRPDFERLREWIRARKVDRVWVVEQSRLTRDEIEWFNLRADLIGADITEVHTNRDGIVKVMDAVAGIKAVINADERRKMLRRQADTLAEKAGRGEPPGVKPFGYVHAKTDDGVRTYEVVPEQAAVIRYAAEKVLAGWSLASVAIEMNKPAAERDPELVPTSGDYADTWKDGVLGVHDGRITPGAVKNWLTVPTIAGLRQHSGEVIGDGNWPAILDKATHRTLKARLTGERAVKRANGGTYAIGSAHKGFSGRKYLLTGGLAICGYNHDDDTTCGVALTGMPIRLRLRKGETTPRVKPYLMCHPKNGGKGHLGIMLPEIEEYVVSELFKHLDSPAFLDALDVEDDQDAERARLVTELSAIEEQRKELAGMWARRERTTSEWQSAKEALDAEERQMNDALSAIPVTSGRIDVDAAREGWKEATLDEQRAFIRRYVAKVTIHSATKMGPRGLDTDRITIDWA